MIILHNPTSFWIRCSMVYTITIYIKPFFEPICAHCTVGSYALLSLSLSICLSVRLSLDNNSYLGK